MSSDIQTTNFVSNINGGNLDLALLTTAWSDKDWTDPGAAGPNRILTSAGGGQYYFPAPYQGTNTAINGQVVTIFNLYSGKDQDLVINTGNMTVFYDNAYYGSFQTFKIPIITIVRFVLLYGGGYYVMISKSGA
jgi:hypothetical protein